MGCGGGEVGGEGGELGDVEVGAKAAEVDAVVAVGFGVGEEGSEGPVGQPRVMVESFMEAPENTKLKPRRAPEGTEIFGGG